MLNKHYLQRKYPLLYYVYLISTQKKADKSLIGETRSFGLKNPDKTFFIIKLNNPHLGLFAIFNCILGYLRVADINGYIPVVDLMNFKNGYLRDEEYGKINAWTYYFKQPTKYSLDEVYQSKNVIFASGISPREAYPTTLNILLKNKKKAEYYFNLINTQLHINHPIQLKIYNEYINIINSKRVLGVLSRGSDYINLTGHTIQPDVETLIAKTKKMLIKWNCDHVFLATEEVKTVAIFKNHFGDKLLTNDAFRINDFDEHVPIIEITSNRKNDKYLRGLEYLTTIILLSQCNCLISSLVNGSIAAIAINQNRYENTYIYDLGVYE